MTVDATSLDTRLAALEEQVADLGDLFKRRLLDDREKQRAFDALYREFELTQKHLRGAEILPVVREVLQVIDRTDSYDGPDLEFAASIRHELLELLSHHGIEEITSCGAFDPALHEIVGAVAPSDTADLHIAAVHRRGYRRDGQLLRAARVEVASRVEDASESVVPDATEASNSDFG